MRDNRGFRGGGGGGGGRGGGGGGRGGRGGRGRSRGGYRGGSYRNGDSRGGGRRAGSRHQGRNPRQSAESGNQRERIAVESGALVLIDQFMLANPQFIDKLKKIIDEDVSQKDQLIREYGGTVVNLTPDRYRIERDPYAYFIVIHPEGQAPETAELSELASQDHGHVFVDTRCLAMIDRELLDDSSLLEKYQQLWFSGQDKACRDLLRDNGGAVRYGFSRNGDELGVHQIPEQDVVALWPDVVEKLEGAEVAEAIA